MTLAISTTKPLATPTNPAKLPVRNFAAEWLWNGPFLPTVNSLAVDPGWIPTRFTGYYAACGPMGVCYNIGTTSTWPQVIKGLRRMHGPRR
jgi:hypothetical protein